METTINYEKVYLAEQIHTSTAIVVVEASQNIINRIKTDDLSFVIYDLVATSGTYDTVAHA